MTVRTKLFVGLIGLVVVCLVAPFAHRFFPSTLRVHMDPAVPWTRVLVESPNLDGPRHFDFGTSVAIRPLQHGLAAIRIQFPDSRIASFEFVHTDAGEVVG